jgi:hypothetical protein
MIMEHIYYLLNTADVLHNYACSFARQVNSGKINEDRVNLLTILLFALPLVLGDVVLPYLARGGPLCGE